MREEKKVVTWSLVILFLSLAIVYSLAYMRKTDIFTDSQVIQKSDEETKISTGNQVKDQNSDIPVIDVNTPPLTSWAKSTTTWTSSTNQSWVTNSNIPTPIIGEDLASTGSIILLSGTSQFFGVLDIVDVLGVVPEYTLQDTKGNYFAYYGKKGLDFVRTIQQLGGNVFTLATESEILQNQLFGDKVSFINMQVFKDKFVLLVIEIEGKTWLLQVPADKYHTNKSYLKSLFIS